MFYQYNACATVKICYLEPLPTTPEPVPGYCPDGWHARGAYCYQFKPDHFATWQSAELECVEESDGRGHLASIMDTDEDQYIYIEMRSRSHIPNPVNYWMGLSRKDTGKITII